MWRPQLMNQYHCKNRRQIYVVDMAWHGCKGVIYVHLYFGRWSKMIIGYLLFARCGWKYQELCHEAPVRICTMAPIASCATPVTTTAFLKPHAMTGRMKIDLECVEAFQFECWSLVVFRVLSGRRWFLKLVDDDINLDLNLKICFSHTRTTSK